MVYIKWTCYTCDDIVISNSKRRHEMDNCQCGASSLDLEEEYARISGRYTFLKRYNYNFFDEIIMCLEKQGYDPLLKLGDRVYLVSTFANLAREMEDEIMESLK